MTAVDESGDEDLFHEVEKHRSEIAGDIAAVAEAGLAALLSRKKPPPEFQGGLDARGLGVPYAAHSRQLEEGRAVDVGDGRVALKEAPPQRQG